MLYRFRFFQILGIAQRPCRQGSARLTLRPETPSRPWGGVKVGGSAGWVTGSAWQCVLGVLSFCFVLPPSGPCWVSPLAPAGPLLGSRPLPLRGPCLGLAPLPLRGPCWGLAPLPPAPVGLPCPGSWLFGIHAGWSSMPLWLKAYFWQPRLCCFSSQTSIR